MHEFMKNTGKRTFAIFQTKKPAVQGCTDQIHERLLRDLLPSWTVRVHVQAEVLLWPEWRFIGKTFEYYVAGIWWVIGIVFSGGRSLWPNPAARCSTPPNPVTPAVLACRGKSGRRKSETDNLEDTETANQQKKCPDLEGRVPENCISSRLEG